MSEKEKAVHEVPVDGILDLHTFNPKDLKVLLPEYLRACREKQILDVRIIHGKGTGVQRERVHAILRRLPEVCSFQLSGGTEGGWGATEVVLFPPRRPE